MIMATTDAKFHVLAVDDSLMDRKLIEKLLKSSSFHVTAVDSGSKALQVLGLQGDVQGKESVPPTAPLLQKCQDVKVNLIITDYCMPGMTGYDLLRKLKESKSLKDIPVVIMSSENSPSRITRCLEEGAEDFFLKPVQMSDVSKLRPHLMKGKAKESKRKDLQESFKSVSERANARITKSIAGLEFGSGMSITSEYLLKRKIHITVSIFLLLFLIYPNMNKCRVDERQ